LGIGALKGGGGVEWQSVIPVFIVEDRAVVEGEVS
jgi:hypothetical protein